MLKNKIFAGVLAVMMMVPFSTGLLSFAAEENTLADYTFEELLAMEKEELCALVENGDALYEKAAPLGMITDTIVIVPVQGEAYLDTPDDEILLDLNIPSEVADITSCYTMVIDGERHLAVEMSMNLNAYEEYTQKDVYITAYMVLSANPDIIYVMRMNTHAGNDDTVNPLDSYTFEDLLAMEKEELCALVDEKENLLYNGEYLYDDAESLYEKRSHILLTINPEDLAEMGITEPENMEEFEALWDALQLPSAVVDSLEYYGIVYGEGMVEYDQFKIYLTGETYQGYEAKEVAITLCMMLNANPLVYYAMFEPIARDDETTAPAETTVPVEITTEAAAETTTETTTEATTATETAETTAFAETTTAAGTTTTGTASGGTSSPKTGDGSTAAVLAGCAAALAGCLLCRKRR